MLLKMGKPEFEFTDERGKIAQLVSKGFCQVNVIYSQKDTERGGHYHKINTEVFYIVKGCFQLTLEKGDIMEEYKMSEGDFFSIAPYVRHSFCYGEDTVLISMYDNGVELEDGNKDIYT